VNRDEARRELADIARGVRHVLEREDARGLGEILARATTQGGARHTPTPTAPAGPMSTPAIESAPERRVDLFGNELAVAPPAAAGAALPLAAPEPVVPAEPVELNPRGWDTRASIHETSLPVLDAIASEVRGCRQCALCETRTKAVPGVGSAQSGIVFVGEAPGADEDAQGEPFVGRAGQLLTRIIQAMDDAKLIPGVKLSRETVYICNVLKCRPPENRDPLPHEIERCSPYLERQLASLEPRIICCLGKFAAELLLGVKGTIAGMRGRVYTTHGAKLIVTYHPAACLRNPGYKRPVWEDMQLLAREYLTD